MPSVLDKAFKGELQQESFGLNKPHLHFYITLPE
jgi:hypothetical protein